VRLALVNACTFPQVTTIALVRIASAITRQGFEHYAGFWQRDGLDLEVFPTITAVPPDASMILIVDDPDQAGILGYHTVQKDGRAYAPIFARPCLEAPGGSVLTGPNALSVTISHEYLETCGDPYATWWADTDTEGEEEALELCDRVEGDSYEIDGVAVSNFLGPRAFRAGPGPYDWMRLLSSPWELRPGGYRIRRKGGPAGETRSDFARGFEQWKFQLARFAAPRGRVQVRGALDVVTGAP
jgi:hypothetical protein